MPSEVSAWSVSVRKTDEGWQARIFPRSSRGETPEKPRFYNYSELDTLLFVLGKELPKLPDEMVPLRSN